MTQQVKIKLTKEQVDAICREITYASTSEPGFAYKNPRDLVVEISESQIIRDKSNVEKWEEVFFNLAEMDTIEMCQDWSRRMAPAFAKHYNADAAYKEVVGNG